MEASFVSRARTAINSAAAKAEKVFTDIKKSDNITNRDLDKESPSASTPESPKDTDESQNSQEAKNKRVRTKPIKTKQDWHERLRNIRIGKKGADDLKDPDNSQMAYALFDENLYLMGVGELSPSNRALKMFLCALFYQPLAVIRTHLDGYIARELLYTRYSKHALCSLNDNNLPCQGSEERLSLESSKATKRDIIPSSAILKQLAVAVEAGFSHSSMKDLLASSRGSSPIREKASISISVMKSLMLREKEDKLVNEFGADEKVMAVINSLVNPGRTYSGLEAEINASSLVKDIHGAPVESLVVQISEAIGCLKTMRKMASFWSRVVVELRRLWYDGQYIPGIPQGDMPDLNSCLLYQQLQVINCCISRKRRQDAAIESLESLEAVTNQSSLNAGGSPASDSTLPLGSCLYARTKSGELVLRLGADRECDNLTMLETGEPIYSPVLQEPPLLTEDLIKETEEFVLRTGSVGAGCSQLLSDMQAFKAANPGCILEDFVRWHSPPDWTEDGAKSVLDDTSEGGYSSSIKGQLSMRMQKEGNLWRELWETSKPVPAVRQAPLYDEDLAVEGILDFLEGISPSELFKQLFIAVLGSGLVIAEATLSTNTNLSDFFVDCKKYILVSCQRNIWVEKLDDICQVYETVETILHNQEEAVNISVQPGETTATGEMKNRFKKLSLIFGGKNKSSSKATPKDSHNTEDTPEKQSFSSIFSKKPPKPAPSPSEKPSGAVENEWTKHAIVN